MGKTTSKKASAKKPTAKKPKATARKAMAVKPGAAGAPNRAVLWQQSGTSSKVWIAEQADSKWKVRFGDSTKASLQEKAYDCASKEEASVALTKAVEAKRRGGYRVAPSYEDSAKLLWERAGLVFDDTSGQLVVTKVGKPASGDKRFKAGTIIETVGEMRKKLALHTIEELALFLGAIPAGCSFALTLNYAKGKGSRVIETGTCTGFVTR